MSLPKKEVSILQFKINDLYYNNDTEQSLLSMVVYKITNKINGKSYVGQTRNSIEKRWASHCYRGSLCLALKNAIDKYGRDNFTLEVIYKACSLEELNKKEKYYIELHGSMAPNGYNLKTGGNSPIYSEESVQKMSESHKGQLGYWLGKKHSEETKQKLVESHLGEKNCNFGKPKSDSTKKKISDAQGNKKAIVCNETGGIFQSLRLAAKELNIQENNIRAVLKGRRKSAGGFTFKYHEVIGV